MEEKLPPAISLRSVRLAEKLRDKEYRDSFIATHTKTFLARQMRKFRGDKSQTEFGNFLGKRQTVVSRMEDPNYGKENLETLFDIARKLNLAVVVRFVDVPTFLKITGDMSPEATSPNSYSDTAIDNFVCNEICSYEQQQKVKAQAAIPVPDLAKDLIQASARMVGGFVLTGHEPRTQKPWSFGQITGTSSPSNQIQPKTGQFTLGNTLWEEAEPNDNREIEHSKFPFYALSQEHRA